MKIDKKKIPANSGPPPVVGPRAGDDLPRRDDLNEQYGRRIEPDRTWTVYHVFSGVPADREGRAMVRLSGSDASAAVTLLNDLNGARRSAVRGPHFVPSRSFWDLRRWL